MEMQGQTDYEQLAAKSLSSQEGSRGPTAQGSLHRHGVNPNHCAIRSSCIMNP